MRGRRLHLQRHSRPQARRRRRAHPQPAAALGPGQRRGGGGFHGRAVLRRASPCSCSFNPFSIVLGIASLAIVAVYPLMKRVTSWPQAVLGLAFSWGALMGWAGTFGSLALAPVLLYFSAFCWTIGYDTIYAMQDARDDAIVGIRSTARLFAGHTRLGVAHLLRRGGGALAGGDPARRRRAARAGRLARLRRPPRLAAFPGRRRGRRDGAEAVPLQPRRGPAPVRGDRGAGVGGVAPASIRSGTPQSAPARLDSGSGARRFRMMDLIAPTDRGLYCEAGDFHIDPWRPVPRAVITHAHADHARFGSDLYVCHPADRPDPQETPRRRGGRDGGLRRGPDPRRRRGLAPSGRPRPRVGAGPRRAEGRRLGRLGRLQGRAGRRHGRLRAGRVQCLHHRIDLRPADLPLAPAGRAHSGDRDLVEGERRGGPRERPLRLRARQGAACARARRSLDRADRLSRRDRADQRPLPRGRARPAANAARPGHRGQARAPRRR